MPDNEIKIPQESQIKKAGFSSFMSRLFGWQRSPKAANASDIKFVNVDVGSNERVSQALLSQLANGPSSTSKMSQKLEDLFNSWLSDNTDKFAEISERKNRVDQITFARLNDPIINKTIALYTDESVQLDEQDTIINIETPDPFMTKEMYKLLSRWGITQTRIRSTIEQLGAYGDAFWANKVSDKGVERVIPLQQLQVTDRLEFNPIKALEIKKRRGDSFASFAGNNYLISQMLQSMEETGDFASLFDTKLFGFAIDGDLVVPPWAVTHFRIGADGSQFWPFGTSPILGALAPFKQTQSTIALQSLARIMNFPVTLYKVKTSDNMDEARQFAVVNRVREAYDNIGVSPAVGSSEAYTINTKIWVPDGLVNVETVQPNIDLSDIDDLKFYENREAIAVGLPPSFFGTDGGWFEGSNASGKSLIQQYKPFARACFSIQSAFLESLADLFRLHFAITGKYDFRTPFTLSMKYPTIEATDERITSMKASMEIAEDVINFIKNSLGLEEGENLPVDIVKDIMAKYSFIDPTDLIKWTRNVTTTPAEVSLSSEDDSDWDLGDLGGDEEVEESVKDKYKDLLHMKEQKKLRERKLIESYNKIKDSLYIKTLHDNSINEFVRRGNHIYVSNEVPSDKDLMLETLRNSSSSRKERSRFKESFKTSFDNSNNNEEEEEQETYQEDFEIATTKDLNFEDVKES